MNLFRNIISNPASKAFSSSSSVAFDDSNDSLLVNFPTGPRRLSYSCPTSSAESTSSSSLCQPLPRKVRFSETRDTLLLTDKERLSNLHKQWYDKLDYKAFHKTLKKDVAMARGISSKPRRRPSPVVVSEFDESDEAVMSLSVASDCSVVNGIEKFVCQRTLMQVEMKRRQHQDAVLDAQDCQASPEQLRRASLEFSEWSLELAMSIAKIDD